MWSHNGGAIAATVGRGRSMGSRPSYAYHGVESLSRLVWRKDTYCIVFIVRLTPYRVHMLAGSRRPYRAVSEQHSRRCEVTTAGRPPPRRAAVAQGGVALRMHISIVFGVRLAHNTSICLVARDGRTMPSASSTVAVVESQRQGDPRHGGGRPPPRWAAVTQGGGALRIYISIVFIVRLAHTTSICSLARHGRTLPSANSTVAVVESQRRGNRRHGGPRSLKGESPLPYHAVSEQHSHR